MASLRLHLFTELIQNPFYGDTTKPKRSLKGSLTLLTLLQWDLETVKYTLATRDLSSDR